MVMGFRERRLGCRLYVNAPVGCKYSEKLDRMLCGCDFLKRDRAYQREVLDAASLYEEAYGRRGERG